MKTKLIKKEDKPAYEPFTIAITIESFEEARALHRIFCHTSVTKCAGLCFEKAEGIRDAIIGGEPTAYDTGDHMEYIKDLKRCS